MSHRSAISTWAVSQQTLRELKHCRSSHALTSLRALSTRTLECAYTNSHQLCSFSLLFTSLLAFELFVSFVHSGAFEATRCVFAKLAKASQGHVTLRKVKTVLLKSGCLYICFKNNGAFASFIRPYTLADFWRTALSSEVQPSFVQPSFLKLYRFATLKLYGLQSVLPVYSVPRPCAYKQS